MKKFFKDDSGATTIELTLIIGAIALAVISIAPLVSGSLMVWFE